MLDRYNDHFGSSLGRSSYHGSVEDARRSCALGHWFGLPSLLGHLSKGWLVIFMLWIRDGITERCEARDQADVEDIDSVFE